MGPFPEAPSKVKFLIVAVDYFTKWIEAEPLVCISGRQVIKFMWKNIVTKFGIPKVLISDNDYSLSKTHSKNGAQRKVSRKGSHQWHTLKRMDRQRCPTERSSMESRSAQEKLKVI